MRSRLVRGGSRLTARAESFSPGHAARLWFGGDVGSCSPASGASWLVPSASTVGVNDAESAVAVLPGAVLTATDEPTRVSALDDAVGQRAENETDPVGLPALSLPVTLAPSETL